MTSKKKAAISKLAIEGELTIYTAAALKEKIGALLNDRAALEIDLSQVAEIDTAGLQLLLLARRETMQREQSIAFSNPSEAVLDCWRLCNLSDTFGVQPTAAQ
jgi:anti-anti-sigma factor